MPVIPRDDCPPALRVFRDYGLHLGPPNGAGEAAGECPWCGAPKFSANVLKEGLWECKKCKVSGNPTTFVRQLYELAESLATEEGAALFALERGLLHASTLTEWGVYPNPLTGEWLVPGYDGPGKPPSTVYRYAALRTGAKPALVLPKDGAHGLHGLGPTWDGKKPDAYLCEGWGDALALWEALRGVKYKDDGGKDLTFTGTVPSSLAAAANVVAAPGANVWKEGWGAAFAGKNVTLLYDNDHPVKQKDGKLAPPVGYDGMRRVAASLAALPEPPASIRYVCWGEDGTDHDPEMKNGYDVRDALRDGGESRAGRAKALQDLLGRVRPIPADWVAGRSKASARAGRVDVECAPCTSWKVLRQAWVKALKWTDGLDAGLSVMLACACSVEVVGDQLWVKIIAPPSTGKSTLCEALSVNKRYVKAVSTLRGFHSGFQTDDSAKEDHSLISQLPGKTLILKDGDTLLTSPDRERILAEARDAYDRVSRTSYRNKSSRSYEGLSFTWILAGTPSLRRLDAESDLGLRFLDCVIMEGIDDEFETSVNRRKLTQLFAGFAAGREAAGRDGEALDQVKAKQLTGGYLDHLRAVVHDKLAALRPPTDPVLEELNDLARLVAYLRGRPSTRQDEDVHREMSTRLVTQLARLAACLAVVLQRPAIDAVVMAKVRKVARDTARGRTWEICRHLYNAAERGLDTEGVCGLTGHPADQERKYLKYLHRLGAVSFRADPPIPGLKVAKPQRRWRLEEPLTGMYGRITAAEALVEEGRGR